MGRPSIAPERLLNQEVAEAFFPSSAPAGTLREADGTPERDATLLMAWKTTAKISPARRVRRAGDKKYDTCDFVSTMRQMRITPHVTQNNIHRSSAMDGRTARHCGYRISQQKRMRLEHSVEWMKMIGLLRKVNLRGPQNGSWEFPCSERPTI